MDAVGYHPYLYDVTTMEKDTLALRQWLDANGHAGVPLDINEFGAAGRHTGRGLGGRKVAEYTQWALCTPALHVENVQAFWWGGVPLADTDPWFSMVNSELSETSFGTAYLSEVATLTSQGCPPRLRPAPPPQRRRRRPRKSAAGHGKRQGAEASKRHKPRRRHTRKPARRPATRRRAVKHR